jgi:transporter family-2 protein
MRITFLLLTVLAGIGLGIQPAVNGRLRDATGSAALAAVVSFATGLVLLGAIMIAGMYGGWGSGMAGMRAAPPWAYAGGAIGAFYVLLAPIALPRIGAASLICAAIFGQQIISLLLDTFGWLGVAKAPLTPTRLLGAGLLLAGVLLLQRKG